MMFFNWVAPRVINDPNRKTLFVTRLVKDAEDISNELSIRGVKHVLITGSRSKKVINEGLLDDESNQAIVGTYGTVGEGFDVKWLNTLVILMPLRASLEQLVGRVQRKSHIIPVMVYDFIAYCSHIAKYQMEYKEDTLTALGFDISYKYMYNDPYDDMI
jgi:superfamily II DNA or RNA helicase